MESQVPVSGGTFSFSKAYYFIVCACVCVYVCMHVCACMDVYACMCVCGVHKCRFLCRPEVPDPLELELQEF